MSTSREGYHSQKERCRSEYEHINYPSKRKFTYRLWYHPPWRLTSMAQDRENQQTAVPWVLKEKKENKKWASNDIASHRYKNARMHMHTKKRQTLVTNSSYVKAHCWLDTTSVVSNQSYWWNVKPNFFAGNRQCKEVGYSSDILPSNLLEL